MAYQLSDIGVRVMDHGVLERLQEVFLELEMRQLFLFQKTFS
jgi:hypothetical protein